MTQDEANEIDYTIIPRFLNAAKNTWNSRRKETAPKFEELHYSQQTIIFARTYHQGTDMPNVPLTKAFYQAALDNDWIKAKELLKNAYNGKKWYVDRVATEVNYLEHELPYLR